MNNSQLQTLSWFRYVNTDLEFMSLWNSLPQKVVSAGAVNSFKAMLEKLYKLEKFWVNEGVFVTIKPMFCAPEIEVSK